MASRKLRNWLKSFVKYAAIGEAPTRFYWWVGVSAIASALRRRVWIADGHFERVPNLYVVLVAPPGIVGKSTTAGISKDLLCEIPAIHFGPDVVTWQKLVEDFAGATEQVPIINGNGIPTYRKMSCLTLHASEFGNLMRPSDEEMTNVLVEMWDGKRGTFKKGTKTSGNDTVENPLLNLLACTTPSWIQENFTETKMEGGFASRCIFLYAEERERKVAYPGRHLPPDFYQQKEDLIHDLEIISSISGPMVITEEAYEWGEQWYDNHCDSKHKNLESMDRAAGGYLARKQANMHKVAMILSVAKGDSMEVTVADLKEAAEKMDDLEGDLPKIFSFGRTITTQAAQRVRSILATCTCITQEELYRRLSKTCTWTDFAEVMKSVVGTGEARLENRSGIMTVVSVMPKGNYYH